MHVPEHGSAVVEGGSRPRRGVPRGYSEGGSTETPRDLRRVAVPSSRAGLSEVWRISRGDPSLEYPRGTRGAAAARQHGRSRPPPPRRCRAPARTIQAPHPRRAGADDPVVDSRAARHGVLARVLRRVEVVVAPEAAPARAPHVLGDLRVVRDHRRRRGARREVEVAPDHPQSLRVVIVAPRLGLLRRVRRGRAARGRERDDRAAAGFEDAPELAERLARVGQELRRAFEHHGVEGPVGVPERRSSPRNIRVPAAAFIFSTEHPRPGHGVAATRLRNIRAANARQRRAAEQRRARDPLHVLGRGPELLAAVRRDVRLAGAGAVDF